MSSERDVVARVLESLPQHEMEVAYTGWAADELAPIFRARLSELGFEIVPRRKKGTIVNDPDLDDLFEV